jgi:hypothetical protein
MKDKYKNQVYLLIGIGLKYLFDDIFEELQNLMV